MYSKKIMYCKQCTIVEYSVFVSEKQTPQSTAHGNSIVTDGPRRQTTHLHSLRVGWRNKRIISFMLFNVCYSCLCTLFWRISDSQFMLIHESVGLVPISAEYLICRHVHTNGLMDGRTHRWTEELIRVGLGNLRFLQVKSFHIIWCLNPEHLLKADNSNGRVLKKESGFFFSSSFFLPVCPPENDQPAESQAHVYKDHGMGIVAWSCRHQQPPVSRFPPSPTTSCSLPPAFVCFVLGVVGCVIRGVSAARRGGGFHQ